MQSTIYTNMDSVRNYNVFNNNASNASRAMERATTGLKIASAKDNASQYAISAKMLERINSNTQASQNVQNDNALLKTAEDGIANTVSILQTLKTHAINAANDSNTDADRANIQKEVDQLIAQIDSNATNVKYNGKALLDGSVAEQVTNQTTATAYLNMDDTICGTKLASYLGMAANTTGQAMATFSWTDVNGDRKYNFQNSVSLGASMGDAVTAATTGANGITAAAHVAANDTITSDTKGTGITAASAGYKVQASSAGRAGDISGLTIQFSYKDKSVSFTLSDIQAGRDTTTKSTALTFQVGEESGFNFDVGINSMKSADLGLSVDVKTKDSAKLSIASIDTALSRALKEQTNIGAVEQRLGFTADTLETINENLQASASTIRDANMAKEISDYMKWNVLMQSSQYMLAQSNQNAFSVLNLLQ